MRILYVTFAFQHPRVRGPARHYHLLRGLSARHAITFLTGVRSEVPSEAREEIGSYTERMLAFGGTQPRSPLANQLVRIVPLVGPRCERRLRDRSRIAQMRRAFRQLVEEEAYDVVVFHGKSIFPVIEGWSGLPMVVDFCDATSTRLGSQMRYAGPGRRLWLQACRARVRQIEKKLIMQTPHVAFISARDREAILGAGSRAMLLPNGVDVQYWKRRDKTRNANCIVFHGAMSYAPNEDGALYLIDQILPHLRRKGLDLEVLVVGSEPSSALLDRARRLPDVTVTGFVEDVRPYLERAAVYVAPLRFASGMQNKLMEALAMEVPCVTTSIAADGLRMDGHNPPVCVAEGADDFAEQILSLLSHGEERVRLAAEGRQFVERHFVWEQSVQKLEDLCLEAVGRWRSERGLNAIGAVSER